MIEGRAFDLSEVHTARSVAMTFGMPDGNPPHIPADETTSTPGMEAQVVRSECVPNLPIPAFVPAL